MPEPKRPLHNSWHPEGRRLKRSGRCPARSMGCGSHICVQPARSVLRPGIRSGSGPAIPNGTLEAGGTRAVSRNLGPGALQRDVNARLLSYRGDMKSEFESHLPGTCEIIEAFTDGINAYIAKRAAPGGRGFPVEFQIAGFQPEPWRPTDCLNRCFLHDR